MNNKEAGIKAELFFCQLMTKHGLEYEYLDDWYDFNVCGTKVEVKSCRICVKETNRRFSGYRLGRFDFTNEKVRQRALKENIWICLILRQFDQFLLIGFVKAVEIGDKRYVALNQLRNLHPLPITEWKEVVSSEN